MSNSPIYGTLDVDSNGNLFVGGEGNTGFFCERSSNAQIGGQTPTFDRSTAVSMGGQLGFGGSIQQDWMECYSWRLIAPALAQTTTFTCLPASCPPGAAQPT